MREAGAEFARFIVAGVVNTAVGFGVFWILNQIFGVYIALANAGGYAVALVVAYALNRYFVFQTRVPRANSGAAFLICFAVAFGINQLVLLSLAYTTDWHPVLIQLIAMASYTVIFFLLNRFMVFRAADGVARAGP